MNYIVKCCICMLLGCSAAVAGFNGTDNFNDNMRNPEKWIPYGPHIGRLSETNEHLEFTSSGIGHEQDAWIWNLNTGSYTQDWYVVVDAVNLSSGSVGIVIGNAGDFGDNFTVDLISPGSLFVSSGWEINGTPYWHAATHPVPTNAVRLKISFDSTNKSLSSSYDSGGGFTELTNLNIASWTMADTNTFVAGVNGWSESYAVTTDTLYVDNFSALTLPMYVETDLFHAVEVEWLSFAGISYQVQYTDDLLSANWNNLGETIAGNGSAKSVYDSTRTSSKRFYRVQVIE